MIQIPSRNDIPVGRENAIGRAKLAILWKMPDRTMREVIAKMRADINDDDGYAILSSSTAPAGYWRSKDPKEIQAFIDEMKGRATMSFVALRGAQKLLKRINHRGQITMRDVMKGA